MLSSYLVRLTPWAVGQPDNERCVKYVPFMWPVPSHPTVGQLTPSILSADDDDDVVEVDESDALDVTNVDGANDSDDNGKCVDGIIDDWI